MKDSSKTLLMLCPTATRVATLGPGPDRSCAGSRRHTPAGRCVRQAEATALVEPRSFDGFQRQKRSPKEARGTSAAAAAAAALALQAAAAAQKTAPLAACQAP